MSDLQMALLRRCKVVTFPLSLSLSKRFPSKNWHRERIVGWAGKYSILSIQFSRKMTRPPSQAAPSALSAKYYRWNSNTRRERGSRRKRISSISQRVAVTVSVMAFGSVVESYSCANPIRALLRVYFRTRVVCIYVGTHPKERWEYHKRFTVAST